MKDLSQSYILLNGEPKSLQIESISQINSNLYCVRFKNNPKIYNYSANKIVWLTNPKWLQPELTKVYYKGVLQKKHLRYLEL